MARQSKHQVALEAASVQEAFPWPWMSLKDSSCIFCKASHNEIYSAGNTPPSVKVNSHKYHVLGTSGILEMMAVIGYPSADYVNFMTAIMLCVRATGSSWKGSTPQRCSLLSLSSGWETISYMCVPSSTISWEQLATGNVSYSASRIGTYTLTADLSPSAVLACPAKWSR